MNNSNIALRALIIYAICLPLAIFLGYLLANPLNYSTIVTVAIVAFLLGFPLLLKWHYPLLLVSWNMGLVLFMVKGQPTLWYLMVALNLCFFILERSLSRKSSFIYVPQVFWPFVGLTVVILVTAKLTGGFGFRSFGSDVYGGKKYLEVLTGILSFFVLTARSIPSEKVKLYVGLFFLGGVTGFIGDLYPITPSALRWVFGFFPPYSSVQEFEFGVTRLRGTGAAAFAVYCWMMMHYGVRGILLSKNIFRPLFFIIVVAFSMVGGFRSTLLSIMLIFIMQFFLEGLHKTKLLAVFALVGLLGAALVVPLASKLPFTFQRALAFLPLEISAKARFDAEDSSKWRLDLWESVWPQVPRHLLLGRGFAISQEDFQMMGTDVSFKAFDASQQGLALSMDYHSGPLSVLIPFGIWGALAFVWLTSAGFVVLWRNFRYGDPQFRIVNTFLFARFTVHVFMFYFVVGGINADVAPFAAELGLSIALNRGVRKPVAQPLEADGRLSAPVLPFRPRHSLQR